MPHQRGWFFHFVNLRTGAREWKSELSSIDTALLLAGVLTVRQCFADDARDPAAGRRDLPARRLPLDARRRSAAAVARLEARVGVPGVAVGSLLRADDPLPARRSDRRRIRFPPSPGAPGGGRRSPSRATRTSADRRRCSCTSTRTPGSISAAGASASRRASTGSRTRSIATRAHRAFCLSLAKEFPGYTPTMWGITASDSRKGYVAWGGPPREGPIDGSVVPSAAAGSLMFAPDITRAGGPRDARPVRRPHLRPVRLRRRLPPDRRLGEPRRHRHRPRHHAAQRREPAHGTRVAVVHAQRGDSGGDAARGADAGTTGTAGS